MVVLKHFLICGAENWPNDPIWWPCFITNKSPWTMFCRKKNRSFRQFVPGCILSIRRHWCSNDEKVNAANGNTPQKSPENHMEPEHESPKNMSPFWSISAISSPDFNPVQRLWMGPPLFFFDLGSSQLFVVFWVSILEKTPCGNDAIH